MDSKRKIDYENLRAVNNSFLSEYHKKSAEVIEKGWYILGQEVDKFEKEYASYNDIEHCIGVASGLDALILILEGLDLPKGSEVIIPANAYIASIISVIRAGLVPVLVEPDIRNYNLDPEKLSDALTDKTSAVMVVHLYGGMTDMPSVKDFCTSHNLYLIEDCAQAHGARLNDKMSGTWGDAAAFSFYPTKNLGALGDAGAIVTSDEKLATKVRMMRNYGFSKKYYCDYLGYNSRLDELQAAFLRVKLKNLEDINNHKRNLAQIYLNRLNSAYTLPYVSSDVVNVFHIFPIRYEKRDDLRKFLAEHNIGTEIHYPVPPHQQECLKDLYGSFSFPISEEIHSTILSLPISYGHMEADIEYVCKIMNKYIEG
ncbi:DegT/DnrJ/EryC1/StrS family aminotransferase [Spirochaeta cellobiosiphila]|uniref:DegT/DnrJ/EryC1/StrS family aminotransferase n=1 Tax=Spirochaeta cellobiosiphila TaxID=504483 RepID=UPI000408DB1F|nr:DegT/DnrJ/EryC1/StrS family aminotransferase [Spirochaeta cellobiosiphila]